MICLIRCHKANQWTILLKVFRIILNDYGTVFSIALFTGISYIPVIRDLDIIRLPVPISFGTTSGRPWFIYGIKTLSPGFIFAAMIPALVLTILIYFDHNVSALLAQDREFRLQKVLVLQ